jgi:hypothetical protein
MNIFFLHLMPYLCAIYHVDKHVVKMCLESCQILCSVHYMVNSKYKPPYKLTHKNHPCCVWVRKSLANYKWLVEMSIELCKEYTFRYGKIHKCQAYIEELGKNLPPIEDIGFTAPALAMPDEYKDKLHCTESSIESYRNYYYFSKYKLHSWKKRDIPEWILEIENLFN